MTEQVTTTEETTTEETQTTVNLSFSTLVELAKLINVCSKRGAFNANELEHVGALYNQLVAFLQASGALATPEEQTEDQGKEENA